MTWIRKHWDLEYVLDAEEKVKATVRVSDYLSNMSTYKYFQMHEYRNRSSALSFETAPSISTSTESVEAWEGLDGQYGLSDMFDNQLVGVVRQTVEEEYSAYITAPLSPQGTDLVNFWEASPFF